MSDFSLGEATWKTSSGDVPVEILKDLGVVKGIRYYLVKSPAEGYEGLTGVPEEELEQVSQTEE